MAGPLPPVVAELVANTSQFSAKMAEARGEMKATAEGGSSGFSKLSSVGGTALFGIAGAAGVVGVATVKMAADFQASMTQLVTGAGESEKNIKTVSDGILHMAGPLGTTTQQLSAGMYMIESAGYHGAAGLSVLHAAAEGAKVGGAELGTVANGLTTALNDYHLPASAAATVTSELVATVARGKTHMQDLAGALSTVLPAASSAHVGLAQVLGAMATMTSLGTGAANAATYLRQTILQLSNPTKKAKGEMDALGLSSIDISKNLGERGLTGTFKMLTDAIANHMGPTGTVLIEQLKTASKHTATFQQALANLPPTQQTYIAALADMVGGTKSMQAALELTGGNAATFNTNVATIGSTAATAGGEVQGMAKVHGDLNFQMQQAGATAQALGIQIGTALIPFVETLMKDLQGTVQWFEKNKGVAEALGGALGTLAAIAIGAFAVNKIAGFISSVKDAITWVGKLGDAAKITAAETGAIGGGGAGGIGGKAAGAAETAAGGAGVAGGEVAAGAGGVALASTASIVAAAVITAVPLVMGVMGMIRTAGQGSGQPGTGSAEQRRRQGQGLDVGMGGLVSGGSYAYTGSGGFGGPGGNANLAALLAGHPTAGAAPPPSGSMKGEFAKDLTLQAQMAVLTQMKGQLFADSVKFGANSAQAHGDRLALTTTANKWGAEHGVSLKGIHAQEGANFISLLALNATQSKLEKSGSGTLDQSKFIKAVLDNQLSNAKTTLAKDETSKASKQAIDQAKDKVHEVKGEITHVQDHIDQLKSVADQITKTKDTISSQQKLADAMSKVNADTSALKSALSTGIPITKLPPQSLKAGGSVKVIF